MSTLRVTTESGTVYTFWSAGMRWERARGAEASGTRETAGRLLAWPDPVAGCRMLVWVVRATGTIGGMLSTPVVSIERLD